MFKIFKRTSKVVDPRLTAIADYRRWLLAGGDDLAWRLSGIPNSGSTVITDLPTGTLDDPLAPVQNAIWAVLDESTSVDDAMTAIKLLEQRARATGASLKGALGAATAIPARGRTYVPTGTKAA